MVKYHNIYHLWENIKMVAEITLKQYAPFCLKMVYIYIYIYIWGALQKGVPITARLRE
jgi:hypothetical protein